MAWTSKILRVNLTAGTCTAEPLNMAWAASYLGQRGLATKYLVEEIDPKVDALSPGKKFSLGSSSMAVSRVAISSALRHSDSAPQARRSVTRTSWRVSDRMAW